MLFYFMCFFHLVVVVAALKPTLKLRGGRKDQCNLYARIKRKRKVSWEISLFRAFDSVSYEGLQTHGLAEHF